MSRDDYVQGLDPLPGGEVPRPAENPDNPFRNKPEMHDTPTGVVRQISEWLRSEEADRLAATAARTGVSVPAVLAHAIADKTWSVAEHVTPKEER